MQIRKNVCDRGSNDYLKDEESHYVSTYDCHIEWSDVKFMLRNHSSVFFQSLDEVFGDFLIDYNRLQIWFLGCEMIIKVKVSLWCAENVASSWISLCLSADLLLVHAMLTSPRYATLWLKVFYNCRFLALCSKGLKPQGAVVFLRYGS